MDTFPESVYMVPLNYKGDIEDDEDDFDLTHFSLYCLVFISSYLYGKFLKVHMLRRNEDPTSY